MREERGERSEECGERIVLSASELPSLWRGWGRLHICPRTQKYATFGVKVGYFRYKVLWC